MPAIVPHRQLDAPPLDWFAGHHGHALLSAEQGALDRVLAGCPALPWAWLGLASATSPEPGRRGLVLKRRREGFDGALRCALPMPLASESFGALMLQHALDDRRDPLPLLEECHRVLAPGGTLWLATLNPWSPWRARWMRSGLRARGTGSWQAVLRRAGFVAGSVNVQWVGPRWSLAGDPAGVGPLDRVRGGLVLTVDKRTHAAVPPDPVRRLRWSPGVVQGAAGRQPGYRQTPSAGRKSG